MELDLFFGRFHPLIVHFPIALLVLAGVIEGISRFSRFNLLSFSLPFVLVAGTLTAFLSVLMGWLIANDRGYDDVILNWHRWIGVSTLILSLLLTLVSLKIIRISSFIRTSFFILLFFLISITGHLGGSLTHGENYLVERAPAFLRSMFIEEKSDNLFSGLSENPDSVIFFRDIIKPLLIKKCTPCHNETQKKGNLVLTSKDGIESGGDGGQIIRSGNAMESELFRRISLPPEHIKFMPLRETPLSYSEVNLIAMWINEGASFDGPLSEFSVNQIQDLLIRDFEFNPIRKPYYESVRIQKADSSKVQELRKLGFTITPLALDNNFLSVSTQQKTISLESFNELLTIKNSITWLDMGDKQISHEYLQIIGQFSSLTKLNLNSNPVSDKDLSLLTDLIYLESLNLYNTEVGDEGLKLVGKLPSLSTVYLWDTKVTPFGIEQIKNSNKRLEVDTGYQISTDPKLQLP